MTDLESKTFTAIDFETAYSSRNSICQIGLVRVENGIVVKTINQLIQPPGNYYSSFNIGIHGISPFMTCSSPSFYDVWGDLKPLIEDQLVVAHNAAFDVSCLKSTLRFYDLAIPRFEQQCTYRIYKKKLSLLCNDFDIELHHHDALSDAMACTQLFLKYLNERCNS
ncbi:MAG: 3'-5' exonuclease [Dysgonamonadaceae bacterium]